MNSGVGEAQDSADEPVRDTGNRSWGSKLRPVPRNLRRLLLLGGGVVALAICFAILLIWGTQGPAYILDLIAAYCL
jgi:hypothetical protein